MDAVGLQYNEEIENRIKDIQREVINDAGIHFGHPYFNTATMAGINRMLLKKLAEYYGIPFPVGEVCAEGKKTPWWMK